MFRVTAVRSAVLVRSPGLLSFCSLPSEAAKEPPKEKPKFNYKTVDQFKSEGGQAGLRESYGTGFSPAKPTARQRKLLVALRMYKTDSDIPEFVSMQTLQHMRDRLRVVIGISATAVFFVFFVVMHDVFTKPTPVDRRKF